MIKQFSDQSPELIGLLAFISILTACAGCLIAGWVADWLWGKEDLLPPPDPSCQRTVFNEWEDTQ